MDNVLWFTSQAIDLTSASLGLMQAITGNEQDSYAEKIRKERIPGATRSRILHETKNFQEIYSQLFSEYTNAFLKNKEQAKTDIDFHLNYGKAFFKLANDFFLRLSVCKKRLNRQPLPFQSIQKHIYLQIQITRNGIDNKHTLLILS